MSRGGWCEGRGLVGEFLGIIVDGDEDEVRQCGLHTASVSSLSKPSPNGNTHLHDNSRPIWRPLQGQVLPVFLH